jgi:hypothetical protein
MIVLWLYDDGKFFGLWARVGGIFCGIFWVGVVFGQRLYSIVLPSDWEHWSLRKLFAGRVNPSDFLFEWSTQREILVIS